MRNEKQEKKKKKYFFYYYLFQKINEKYIDTFFS